jgi:diguanylate cyclase (GGDEF)-like protein
MDKVLAQISRQATEAVVFHVQGSKIDTVAFLERLRENQSDACVILLGPDPGAERTAAFLRAGAFDYLTQPVPPDRLEESLREGLEVRRSFIEVRELSDRLKATNEELARERDGLKQWNRNLILVNELSQALAGTLDADEIVRMVGDRLAQILHIDLLGLLWLRPTRVLVHTSAPLDEGLVDQVRQSLLAGSDASGLSSHLPDASRTDSQGWSGGKGSARPRPRHRLLTWPVETIEVPLMASEERLGVIRLLRLNEEPFDDYQVELIRAVVTSLALALRNAEAHRQAQSLAITDGLTSLLNRRAFSNILAREFREAERYRTPLCLIMADLDHFKMVNDRFGHVFGDRLLKDVAMLIRQAIRSVDVATRYGGEEFAIILPRTNVAQALALADRIREAVALHSLEVNGLKVSFTVSIGVAQAPNPRVRTVEEFVSMADAMLYRAKARGRDRVEAAPQTPELPSDVPFYAQSLSA